MPVVARTVSLLVLSNVFMTFAWYAHLRNLGNRPWIVAALVSWGIALIEYCFAVPANRIGHGTYTAAQLKTIQEVITLIVFTGFSVLYLKESISLTTLAGFALIAVGAGLVFRG